MLLGGVRTPNDGPPVLAPDEDTSVDLPDDLKLEKVSLPVDSTETLDLFDSIRRSRLLQAHSIMRVSVLGTPTL